MNKIIFVIVMTLFCSKFVGTNAFILNELTYKSNPNMLTNQPILKCQIIIKLNFRQLYNNVSNNFISPHDKCCYFWSLVDDIKDFAQNNCCQDDFDQIDNSISKLTTNLQKKECSHFGYHTFECGKKLENWIITVIIVCGVIIIALIISVIVLGMKVATKKV